MNSRNGESKTTVIQHLDDGLVFFFFFCFSVLPSEACTSKG